MKEELVAESVRKSSSDQDACSENPAQCALKVRIYNLMLGQTAEDWYH